MTTLSLTNIFLQVGIILALDTAAIGARANYTIYWVNFVPQFEIPTGRN